MKTYSVELLYSVSDFLEDIDEKDRAKIFAHISSMREDISSVPVRPLTPPLKELKYKNYRLVFFIEKSAIYFIHSFVKKTQKTPKKELDYAYDIYKYIKNSKLN